MKITVTRGTSPAKGRDLDQDLEQGQVDEVGAGSKKRDRRRGSGRRWGRAKKPASSEGGSGEETRQWSSGHAAWATRATSAALWAAVAAGPVALTGLALGVGSGDAEPVSVASGQERVQASSQVSAYATSLVRVWLTSAEGEESRVTDLAPWLSQIQLPASRRGAVDVEPARVELVDSGLAGGTSTWQVVVGATVTEAAGPAKTTKTKKGKTKTSPVPTRSVRRFYAVPVAVSPTGGAGAGAVTALALPAPAPAPVVDEVEVAPEYGGRLSVSSLPGVAVQDFLEAYLTGGAPVDRFTSPGAEIAAVTPPAAKQIEVREVAYAGEGEVSTQDSAPETGEQLRVLVTVVATDAAGEQSTTQYALSLEGRDGRWEVAAVDAAPVTQAAEDATPSPSGSSTSGSPSGDPQ